MIAAFCIGFAIGLIGVMLRLRQSLYAIEHAVERIDEDEAEAYAAGVGDGYGYAKEPWREEYQKVGAFLKANCSGQFPELADDEDDL